MNRQFQKRDLYLNLLPREYLPEPQFKAFPFIAVIALVLLGLLLFRTWDARNNELKNIQAESLKLGKTNNEMIPRVIKVPVLQANARYILSYLYILPGLIDLGPDWLNIYLELDNTDVLPLGCWVQRMSFVGGNERGVWPGIRITGISTTPGAVEKVLNFAEALEKSDQFVGVNLKGWQWTDLPGGATGVVFNIDSGIEH